MRTYKLKSHSGNVLLFFVSYHIVLHNFHLLLVVYKTVIR